ncbi:HAMP domain-containing histidine kinase [Streptococcus suis]|nr:HAMP domain-containing histidine kinase [Streptococcus suis]
MNLQKRIFRLNMLMLGISLLAMLAISVFVVNNIYLNRSSLLSTSQKTAMSQTSIEEFSGTDYVSLAEKLASGGAQLYVESDGFILFSNIQEDVEDITAVGISETTHLTYIDEEIVISRQLETQGQMASLYAVIEDTEDQQDAREFQTFLLQIALMGGTGILVILLLNLMVTKRILQAIMKPMDELHKGVERIRKGNYQENLDYSGDREFEELTEGFNQMQTSLLEAQEKNRLYEQNRTQMVADISHDLRTPLTSIKGYAKGILDGVANTEEKQQNYMTIIYQKSLVMEKLLEKLFVFSQLETDKLPFDTVEVDLREFFKAYISEKKAELADEAVDFRLEVAGELPVEMDPVQFRRILDNLVDNARKYANTSPLLLTITGTSEDNQVVWTFADNGQGVSKDQLDKLFTEFYRVDQARQQVDGHGLGLSIVNNIVHRLGGTIVVENKAGLTFTIRLPKKG